MKSPITRLLCLAVFLLVFFVLPAAMAETSYPGEWVCIAVDMGTGERQTEFQGVSVSDLARLTLKEDGTLTVVSFGKTLPGNWVQTPEGITCTIEDENVIFLLQDGQLVNDSNGTLMYLQKSEAKPAGGLLSLINGSKYTGQWEAEAFESGGVRTTQSQGIPVSQLITFQINRDGTLAFLSMGTRTSGTWRETAHGITVTVDQTETDIVYAEGKLVATSEGVTIYLIRSDVSQATPAPKAFSFAGLWKALRYETMGYSLDAGMLFPDGCTIALQEDGTGEAFLTKDFIEKITWSEKDGLLAISGSFVFSNPVYNAATGELSMHYGSDVVTIFFQRTEGERKSTAAPNPMPTPLPASPSPSPSPTPTVLQATEPPAKTQGKTLTTALFTLPFPGEGWTLDEGWVTDRADYCGAQYDMKGADGYINAKLSLYVSQEKVKNYRDKIKSLTEFAAAAGREAPGERLIGGVRFFGEAYERWGWQVIDYVSRVEAAGITITITIEQPQNIGNLEAILDSISFTLPVFTLPNVDPPMPEDGEPYVPQPSSADTAAGTVKASWLKAGSSILLDGIFDNNVTLDGKRLYVLVSKALSAYIMADGTLVPDQTFAGGVLALPDEFEHLSPGKDGLLYVSQGIFNILAVKDGEIVKDNGVSGDLVMHPGGEWGISFWANADPQKITAADGGLTASPWVLANLSEPTTRQGRFSMVSCVAISDTRVYVAGSDALNGDAQRVAVYDLEGKELFSFGNTDWMKDDAFGSVTGITQTRGGILVLDGNYRALKLFSSEGEFLWSLDADSLLGTDYPWLFSMVPTENGVLVAAAQERRDGSGTELLLFELTGF